MPRGYNNYSFVVDSEFKPFTLQEMLTPYLMYQEEYDKDKEAMIELASKADKFKYLASTLDPESKAAKIYNDYANDLAAQAKDFGTYGRTRENAAALLDLRRRYSGEIGLIDEAVKLRNEDINLQRELYMKDPTVEFDDLASSASLDKYLAGQRMPFRYTSGALIQKQVSDKMSAIAKSVINASRAGQLDETTMLWAKEKGLRAQDVIDAVLNPNGSGKYAKLVNAIVEDTLATNGVYDWATPEQAQRLERWGLNGAWSGIGETDLSTYTDAEKAAALKYKYDTMAANDAMQRQLAMKVVEAKIKAQQKMAGIAPKPLNIYSPNDVKAGTYLAKKFSQFFYTDREGKTRLTDEGIREYKATRGKSKMSGNITKGELSSLTDGLTFGDVLDNLGADQYIKNGKFDTSKIGELWDNYVNQKGYDGTRVTEYEFTPEDGSLDTWKRVIQIAARGTDGLEEVEYDSEKHAFVPTGKTLKMKDLNDDKVQVLSTRMSPYSSGNGHYGTVMIKDKEGVVRRYKLPNEINPVNEGNRDKALMEMLTLQQAISSKKITKPDGTVINLGPAELAKMQAQYEKALERAQAYHSQLVLTNKVKPNEFDPLSY